MLHRELVALLLKVTNGVPTVVRERRAVAHVYRAERLLDLVAVVGLHVAEV